MTAVKHDVSFPFDEQQQQRMRADDILCGETVLGVVLSVVVTGVVMMAVTVLLVI